MSPAMKRSDGPRSSGSNPTIQLTEPWFDDAESHRVAQALAGRVAGNGPFGQAVEARLESMLGAPRVLLTTSCTHALELALMALGVGPGQEVICPSFTFVSTANAVLRVGARPVFAEIEGETLGLDPSDVARRLTPGTTALLPVHYAGVAPDMDALLSLASGRKLRVIEDAAQGLGASYRGRPLGTLGDAGGFSFHETKNITCGEGGALAIRDPEVAERAEMIREKGTNRSAFLRGDVDKYTWVLEGSSYVLSDILAAVLDAQLDKLNLIQERRARLANQYRAGLSEWAALHGVRIPRPPPGREGNHHVFYLLLPDGATRDLCLTRLRQQGIGAAFHYIPLHSSPFGSTLGYRTDDFPVTNRVAETLLRLPLHPKLGEAEVDRVIEALRETIP